MKKPSAVKVKAWATFSDDKIMQIFIGLPLRETKKRSGFSDIRRILITALPGRRKKK